MRMREKKVDVKVREPIPGKEGYTLATGDQIYEWSRLRVALIKLGFEPCKYPDNKVYLYPGEIAVRDRHSTFFIMMKDDIGKVLRSLPLDTKGNINKMKYKREERERQLEEQMKDSFRSISSVGVNPRA